MCWTLTSSILLHWMTPVQMIQHENHETSPWGTQTLLWIPSFTKQLFLPGTERGKGWENQYVPKILSLSMVVRNSLRNTDHFGNKILDWVRLVVLGKYYRLSSVHQMCQLIIAYLGRARKLPRGFIFSRSTLRNHFLFLVRVLKHEIDKKYSCSHLEIFIKISWEKNNNILEKFTAFSVL